MRKKGFVVCSSLARDSNDVDLECTHFLCARLPIQQRIKKRETRIFNGRFFWGAGGKLATVASKVVKWTDSPIGPTRIVFGKIVLEKKELDGDRNRNAPASLARVKARGGGHIKIHMRHSAGIFCAEVPSRTDR